MGVERSVTRWFVLRQSIMQQIAQLEAQLADKLGDDSQHLPAEAEILAQLKVAQFQLKTLGPCPKPMMG